MNRLILVLVLLALVSLPLVSMAANQHEIGGGMNKYAVVFGIGKGPNGENLGGDGDADLMVNILARAGFPRGNIKEYKNYSVTYNLSTGQSSFRDATQWLASVCQPGDEAVWFFSGHGGTNCLQVFWPTTTGRGKVTYGYVAVGAYEIASWLAPLQAQKVAILIQSCYSGSCVDEFEAPNRLVISSTLPDHLGANSGKLSSWGSGFLDYGIKRGQADLLGNGDGMVSLQETFDYYAWLSSGEGVMSDWYGQEFFL